MKSIEHEMQQKALTLAQYSQHILKEQPVGETN